MSAPAFSRVQRSGIEACEEEAARLGASAQVVRHNKHIVIEIRIGDAARKFTLSTSPRTDGYLDWARQSVRRAVRAIQGDTP